MGVAKAHRDVTRAERAEAAELYLAGTRSLAEVGRLYGVSAATIGRWVRWLHSLDTLVCPLGEFRHDPAVRAPDEAEIARRQGSPTREEIAGREAEIRRRWHEGPPEEQPRTGYEGRGRQAVWCERCRCHVYPPCQACRVRELVALGLV